MNVRFWFFTLLLIPPLILSLSLLISGCVSTKTPCEPIVDIRAVSSSESGSDVGDLLIPGESLSSTQPPKVCFVDGCSVMPDFGFGDCCDIHDVSYWRGGSMALRKTADLTLRQCIQKRGYPTLSRIYYWGVRMGGVSWLPTPWRWGFGWEYPDYDSAQFREDKQ